MPWYQSYMSLPPSRSQICEYFPVCNACQLWDTEYEVQKANKTTRLKEMLRANDLAYPDAIDFVSCGNYGLRDRIDFTFIFDVKSGKTIFGFYNSNKELVAIKKCLQMSTELQEIFTEFVSIQPRVEGKPISKGSVRLRRGVSGIKGCWLDLANVDIKSLLNDRIYLNELLNAGFKVEMGQKGKSLVDRSGELKLNEPHPQPWFKTFNKEGLETPLYCLISDFTQPSWKSAKQLNQIVLEWVEVTKTPGFSVAEFGPGIGQFTRPLLDSGIKVQALEVDASACENLLRNTSDYDSTQLKLINADFHRTPIELKADLILVNPARAGLKKFTDAILKSNVDYIIYVSCFPESMSEDLLRLKENYRIKEIKIVDQFPQTNHFESCVLLEKFK